MVHQSFSTYSRGNLRIIFGQSYAVRTFSACYSLSTKELIHVETWSAIIGHSGEVVVKVALVAQETNVVMSESSAAYHIYMRINLDCA